MRLIVLVNALIWCQNLEQPAASSCNPGNISKYSDNLKTEISSLNSAQYSSTLYQMLLLVTHKTQDPLILNKVSLRSSLAKVAEVSILVWRRGDSPKLFLECRVEGRKFLRIKFGFLQADYCPRISTSVYFRLWIVLIIQID